MARPVEVNRQTTVVADFIGEAAVFALRPWPAPTRRVLATAGAHSAAVATYLFTPGAS